MEANKQYKVEYLPSALRDISQIVALYATLSGKSSAQRINRLFNNKADSISLFPYSSVRVPKEIVARYDFYMAIVEDYLMIYRIFEDENKVVFYRVLNGKKNYANILKRIAP